ncbi:hypothetical protein EDC04DRAFT_2887972 [Pisolithus marmoratus]|nr:hypothetical protein EDC04DRAFT_2887972 [Pisolithus marmoratus]
MSDYYLSNEPLHPLTVSWATQHQGGKKTSNAGGKQRATDKDGEGTTSGSKKRAVEKKIEVKKTSVQEFVEHIWGVINEATLGLMAWHQWGGGQTAPKKTSKAKGKQKATGKDGEDVTSGSKWRVVEKKMTYAIKEVKKSSAEELMVHIRGVYAYHEKGTVARGCYQCPYVVADFSQGSQPLHAAALRKFEVWKVLHA